MEIKDTKITSPKVLEYNDISEEVSTIIINDAVDNFNEWWLYFPKTYQKFNNAPNANYSKGSKDFLGIYDLLYK